MTFSGTRSSMACLAIVLSALRVDDARAQESASNAVRVSAFERQKAERLLRDHLPCLGCHKLNGEGGSIGPDLTTVRERRSRAYISSIVAMPQSIVPGTVMPRTPMPRAQLVLITRYLASLPGHAPDSAMARTRPPPAAGPPDGAALYAKWCASCHGTGGAGDGPNAANLPVKPAAHASRAAMSVRPDDSLFDTIAGGGAIMNRSPRMPAFGAELSAAEIRALVRHIRALCRCEGPSWSRQ